MVTIYTQDGCAPCDMAKRYFEKLNVKYTEKHRDQYADEMIQLGGRITTPLIVSDKGMSYGFSPMELSELI